MSARTVRMANEPREVTARARRPGCGGAGRWRRHANTVPGRRVAAAGPTEAAEAAKKATYTPWPPRPRRSGLTAGGTEWMYVHYARREGSAMTGLTVEPLSQVCAGRVWWLWEPYLPRGKLTL